MHEFVNTEWKISISSFDIISVILRLTFRHYLGMLGAIGQNTRQPLLRLLSYCDSIPSTSLWRHNDHNGVSNHHPHDCLLNLLFRHRSKKTSKLHITGLCAGNSLVTGEFPAQRASNAENVSIWWRHHEVSAAQLNIRQLQIKSPYAQSSNELQWIDLTNWGRDKMAAISRRHFGFNFLEWKCVNFD